MAGISISVRSNLFKLADQLDDLARKQLPFATARALTEVAMLANGDVVRSMPERFVNPVPFTQRAFGVEVATKSKLRARIYLKNLQAQYLAIQETGGTVTPGNIVVPVTVRLNAFHNFSRGQLKAIGTTKNVFVGTVQLRNGKSIVGWWRRLPNNRLTLLAVLKPKATYKPRFGYHETISKRLDRDMTPILERQLDNALKTAAAKGKL